MSPADRAYYYIKKETNHLFPNSQVILFGSRARGDNDELSDYDFLIITQQQLDTRLKLQYKAQLRKALAKHKIPTDILIESQKDYLEKSELNGHIIREIKKEGRIL